MPLDDIAVLTTELPEAVQQGSLPSDWDDDWIIVPIDDAEGGSLPADFSEPIDAGNEPAETVGLVDGPWGLVRRPGFGEGTWPGSPRDGGRAPVPPPDALAFYLPFHRFYPQWWGVYLLHEGVDALAHDLCSRGGGALNLRECAQVARIFLYGHEQFHHAVETFAMRLEVTHRQVLYIAGFDKLYRRVVGTDDCLEEALASAHGYRKVRDRAFKKPKDPKKRRAAMVALEGYVQACGPGYRRALEFLRNGSFLAGRCDFAEGCQHESLPAIPRRSAALWRLFPKAFDGMARVTSRVNYLVNRDSPLGRRQDLALRYLRYREVADRLRRLAACRETGHARGSHVQWTRSDGGTFPVPRHPGDLAKGTLAKIIKQAGLDMSVSEFAAAG